MFDIFIEPRIYYNYDDKVKQTPVRKKVDISFIIEDDGNHIISGEAGTGKTVLLKKIGEELIFRNKNQRKRNIPFFINTIELFEFNFSINEILNSKLKDNFVDKLAIINEKYTIYLLIDSIDEFEEETQKKILGELNTLSNDLNITYILSSRNSEKLVSLGSNKALKVLNLHKFNNKQIKTFVSSFFLQDQDKANGLLDALKDNRIIERMPITPLTLSLISILYEESNLEIPSTIADIYDNFNSLIIGRLTVSSKVEFIDISFKERILSLYALHVLSEKDNKPLEEEQFIKYFEDYFEGKTLPIKKGTLKEVLKYLINNTGILVIKENRWISFSHDSYMEYYAALEIFKHQRSKEKLLIDNFLDHHWQNVAIFYAGKSKDQPDLLKGILSKLETASNINDYYMGVMGSGYILQALYQTDNKLRKEVIIKALDLNMEAYETIRKLGTEHSLIFKDYSIPIFQLMSLLYFYENFNSLTLKEPLKLAFKDINELYNVNEHKLDAFKALQVALTLGSKRINSTKYLKELMNKSSILNDPSLYLISYHGMEILDKSQHKTIQSEIKKQYLKKVSKPIQTLVEIPASKLRFTDIDSIQSNKHVRLIVEGKSDALIIEHAYYVLTEGELPYWSIKPAGNSEGGGAREVQKSLIGANSLVGTQDYLIGLFDNDEKGIQEFNGLTSSFNLYKNSIVYKKHKESNIYAACLPIPGEMDHYIYKDQKNNYFAIENYFDIELLKSLKIEEKIPLDNDIYKVKNSKKKGFADKVQSFNNPYDFRFFIHLFRMIDLITGREIEYIE